MEEVEYYGGAGLGAVQLELRANQLSVGPKYSLELKRWLAPYATAQGLVTHSIVSMGDQLDKEEANTYLRDSALGVGAVGALGLELRSRPVSKGFQLNSYLEVGGGISSNMNFKANDLGVDEANIPIGDLKYGGQYVRFGVGTRF